jgi:hypothetical protein
VQPDRNGLTRFKDNDKACFLLQVGIHLQLIPIVGNRMDGGVNVMLPEKKSTEIRLAMSTDFT